MNWFNNLSTRTKLIVGFGLIWALLLVVGHTAHQTLQETVQSERELFESKFPLIFTLQDLRSHVNFIRGQVFQMLEIGDEARLLEGEKLIDQRVADINKYLTDLPKWNPDPKFLSRLKQIQELVVSFLQTRDQIGDLIRKGKKEEALQLLLGIQHDRHEKIRQECDDLADEERAISRKKVDADLKNVESTVWFFQKVIFGAFLTGVLLIILMTNSVAQPLRNLSEVAARIASGDLTVELAQDQREDEIGTLSKTLWKMVETLIKPTYEIAAAVQLLGSSSSEILAATNQVATGTAETATAISETTTTVEEVRQAAQQSSQKARFMSDSAQRVAQISQNGMKAIGDTGDGMAHIRDQMESIADTIVQLSEQGQSIGEIIATVTDLADQSNLLAVNASIEAAKAGDQGRGFAVVAQEIKSLAEQSKQATTQIRGILNQIQKATAAAVMATEQGTKAVEAGVKQSNQASEAIQVLAQSVEEATQAAQQIVASSQQQVVGMDQIGVAMENINQAGAQTAASMQQSEVAARNLHELGMKLKGLVDQYKIKKV